VKFICSLLVTLFFARSVSAQVDASAPVYLRFPTVPQFTIYKATDSSAFTREDLKKRTSTVLFIFSPDCEHCQHETKELISKINKFKRSQVIMVTSQPYQEMVRFYKDYHIADYPQITMGRDTKFFFPVYFRVQNLPSIFVYNKKGELKKAFE
jgi:cytochrome oxidase Cu insertion factor (SCO1/SenC/PrrC family)